VTPRNALNGRWQAIQARLSQIAAASGLDQELCRAEVEKQLSKQNGIQYLIGLNGQKVRGAGRGCLDR
jgi:hypothetical protein